MKTSLFRLPALLIMLLAYQQMSAQQSVCRISVSDENSVTTNNSEWQGWGTSLCWWANRIGYDDTLVKLSADAFFDARKGLGLNIMRYNIGGGDDPSHHHITRTDSDVPGWQHYDAETGQTTWDYEADARQLNVMKAACKSAGQDAIIEVFSNSPPYFMTNSGCSTGSFKSDENNLRDDCYEQFADYLANVTCYIENELKLKVTSVSPMNEPNTNYWPAMNYKQEGCHFDAGEPQSRILTLTRRALDRYGLGDVMVVTSDETNPGLQIDEIRRLSPEARSVIGRINTHTYGTNSIREMGRLAKEEGINLWMSEVDGNGTIGPAAGEMSAGLWIADKIVSDIEALEPSAWVLWQVIDTHVCAEGYQGRVDKGPLNRAGGYWGTAWADHDADIIELTQKYYAIGQFSRYIRPGSTVILCNPDRRSGCRAIAARDGRHITVVVANLSADAKPVEIDLSGCGVRNMRRSKQIRTSGSIADGEHWAESKGPAVRNGILSASLAPYSITTFCM